jgi:hypothetical protein
MRTLVIVLLWGLPPSCGFAEDFIRPLPDPKICSQLTQQKFPNSDGVIIIKEQSLNVHRAEIGYGGLDLVGIGMTRTTILIAKVFNEAGVRRFGSFEYEYYEYFGDEIPAKFVARARVQKPDGSVTMMPENDVSIVVSHKNNQGVPLARKALFKVPNLMAGDVVQIEYSLREPFTRTYSGIFYYQDRMPVLFSNLVVTCQARDDVRVFSFPAERVGEPKISQIAQTLGSGETRFWSVKNLNAIPDEPHAPPFEELSVLTAFVADEMSHKKTDWNRLAKEFWEEYLDKGSVKRARVNELGFLPPTVPVTLERVDSLYTALRKSIVLSPVNKVYPLVDELDDVFEKRNGDASDLAAIFYKILRGWEVDARAVWLRDRRKGAFQSSVPTVRWFDRIGVLVKVGTTEKLYDFDRAIANWFSTPWFLKGITAMVIDGEGCRPMTTAVSKPGEAWLRESHELTFGERFTLRDSMVTTGLGAPVEEWREDGYELKGTELQSYLQGVASAKCIEKAEDVRHSPLLDEREVKVTVTGSSKSSVAVIDSFVSVRPANHLLKALQEEFLAPARTNDVVLDEPFTATIEWTIHHPASYVLAAIPKDTTIGGFPGGLGSIACGRNGDDAHLTVRLDLKTQVISAGDYSSMIRLLTGLLRGCEQAVTFRKN